MPWIISPTDRARHSGEALSTELGGLTFPKHACRSDGPIFLHCPRTQTRVRLPGGDTCESWAQAGARGSSSRSDAPARWRAATRRQPRPLRRATSSARTETSGALRLRSKSGNTAPPLAAGVSLFEGVVLVGSRDTQVTENVLRNNGHDGLMITGGSRTGPIPGVLRSIQSAGPLLSDRLDQSIQELPPRRTPSLRAARRDRARARRRYPRTILRCRTSESRRCGGTRHPCRPWP
jgi:hypothetical protein